ncbi:MAG: sulfur carrier protein ThiS [Candidatus Margulisbacteria bacterium]|nr:sulfur carrier protein ThiS [Candidatus Margulisiibacteriota bacterium]
MDQISVQLNGVQVHLTPCSVASLIHQKQLNPEWVVVELNGAILPMTKHATTHIKQDDCIEIIRYIGGGQNH